MLVSEVTDYHMAVLRQRIINIINFSIKKLNNNQVKINVNNELECREVTKTMNDIG